MTPPDDTRPEQRHDDLMELSRKLSAMTATHQTVKKAATFLVGAIVLAIIPLMITGVVSVVRSAQTQEVMVNQFGDFKTSFKEFQREQKTYNERTSVMWHRGGWDRENTSSQ